MKRKLFNSFAIIERHHKEFQNQNKIGFCEVAFSMDYIRRLVLRRGNRFSRDFCRAFDAKGRLRVSAR